MASDVHLHVHDVESQTLTHQDDVQQVQGIVQQGKVTNIDTSGDVSSSNKKAPQVDNEAQGKACSDLPLSNGMGQTEEAVGLRECKSIEEQGTTTNEGTSCGTLPSSNEIVALEEEITYPSPPEEPLASDCCGSGCQPCVYDIYEQELERWRHQCDTLKSQAAGGTTEGPAQSQECCLSTEHYRGFTLERIIQEAADVFIYRFTLPGHTSLSLTPGQHLILRGDVNGKSLTRQYTPISEPAVQGYFDILIRLYEDGRMSQFIRSWQVGDVIDWRGPFGTFNYKPNSYRHVLLLAAGTGIAPMMQFIRHIIQDEDDETFVRLVYSVKSYADILMKAALEQWTCNWNFTAIYVLTQENVAEVKTKYGEEVHFGRITEDFIRQEIEARQGSKLVLISGTKSFDKDMINYAKRNNISQSNIYKF